MNINLTEPRKDEKVKADLVRDMIKLIRARRPVAGFGLRIQETETGSIISLASIAQKAAPYKPTPRCFDIKSIVAGSVTLTNCYWQVGSKYYSVATEPAVTAVTGILCAVINTKTNAVTAVMNYVWTEATPELIPVQLYKVAVSGAVVTIQIDLRGSMVSLHE